MSLPMPTRGKRDCIRSLVKLRPPATTATPVGVSGPRAPNVWLWEQITRVYDDQLSVEDYLAGMQKEFEEEFAEGLIPPIPAR